MLRYATAITLMILVSAGTVMAQPTATPTPIPDVSGNADRERALDRLGMQAGYVELGKMLRALWRSRLSGGAPAPNATPNTTFDVAAGNYAINGEQITTSAANDVALTGISTTGSQYRKVTICVNSAGTHRVHAGSVAATQAAALKRACWDSEAEAGYLELPTSFTGATTAVTGAMCKQDPTLASQVKY